MSNWVTPPQQVFIPQAGLLAIGRLLSIPEVAIAYTALTAGIGCYHFPATVLGGVSEENMPEGISGFRDDGANYLQILKGMVTNLQDLNTRRTIISILQRLNPSVSALELDSIRDPKDAIVSHKFGEQVFPLTLAQESDGFRRFYAYLLALYQSSAKQTLLFEEPENGIYPGALALLANEFKAAPAAGRGQIILTTHSPGLLDHFSEEEIRVVDLDEGQTRIGRISREQQEALKEQLLEPGELLTVDPARIAEAKAAFQ